LAPKSDITVIQQNSIVATNQIVVSKYAAKYPTTTQRKILWTDWNPWSAGQCIGWIRAVTGVNFSGNASEWVKYVNSQVAEIDTIVVLNVSKYGHIGLIIDKDDTSITVRSRNYQGLWVVSDDKFDLDDSRILGYIRF